MAPKLRISAVSKSYGNVIALQPTSLELAKGEFLTLLGPSGSGKTTLLSLIAGLTPPDGGRIELDGVDITDKPPHQRGLGMVFQNYALFPHLSVAQNVAFGLTTRRLETSEVNARTDQALRMIRLEHLAHRLPGALSGGQQQRVALARALAYSPSVILMDEPLGALDRNLREEMKFEIARLHRELGTTVVYVTHDQEEALVLSTRICLMAESRVEQWGTPQDLYFTPATRYAAEFIGESNLFPCQPSTQVGAIDVPSLGLVGLARSDVTGKGWLLVRPESIDVNDDRSNAQSTHICANVESVQMLGAVTRLHLSPSGSTCGAGGERPVIKALLRTVRDHLPSAGNSVSLSCDLLAAHFIAASNDEAAP